MNNRDALLWINYGIKYPAILTSGGRWGGCQELMCTCARGEHDPITCPARRWFGQVLFFKLSQRFEIIFFCLFIRLLMKTDVLFGIVNAIWASAIRNRIIKACIQKNNDVNILKLLPLFTLRIKVLVNISFLLRWY